MTAGLGTRLRPLSYVRAKPAVPVAGEPLICRILRWLSHHGVRDVVLNLHYKPETITSLVGDGSEFGVRVRYSWEPRILGTAGGPRRALPLLGSDRFFLINGDTLSNVDLRRLAATHLESGARVTLALIPNPRPEHYGGVVVDEAGYVSGFTRPAARPALHFVGVQAVDAGVFATLPEGEPVDTVGRLYDALLARQPRAIRAYSCSASFHDVGTPADYLATCLALAPPEQAPRGLLGMRLRAHPTSRIVRTAIWDDVVVGAGCELTECVVADGVDIPAGRRFTRCAIVNREGREPAAGESIAGELLVSDL